MRNAIRIAGAAGLATLGVMSVDSTAFAQASSVGVLNDNNVDVLRTQVCGNALGVAGRVVQSQPQLSQCDSSRVVVGG